MGERQWDFVNLAVSFLQGWALWALQRSFRRVCCLPGRGFIRRPTYLTLIRRFLRGRSNCTLATRRSLGEETTFRRSRTSPPPGSREFRYGRTASRNLAAEPR